jgi:hypothetical protein
MTNTPMPATPSSTAGRARAWPALLAAVLLAACGGGGDAPRPPPTGSGPLAAAQSGELVKHAQAALREREKRLAANPGDPSAAGDIVPTSALPAAGFNAGAATRSSTLVQESGVDEADLIKTDGTHLVSLAPSDSGRSVRLQSHRRAADGSIAPRGTLELPRGDADTSIAGGLVMDEAGRALVVLTSDWRQVPWERSCAGGCPGAVILPFPPVFMLGTVGVQRVELDDGVPKLGTRVTLDGQLVDSRRIGERLYVVTSHRPRLPIDALPMTAPAAEREAAIAALRAEDLLPQVRVNGGPSAPLVKETECWVQPGNASLAVEFTTVTVFDLASPTLARTSRCFAGGSEAIYMSPSSLVLATTRWVYTNNTRGLFFPADMRTDLHKFALERDALAYRGSADVPGHLGWNAERKSYRMSEHDGVLRVLTFTGSTGWRFERDAGDPSAPPPSPATLTVLREAAGGDAKLQVVATLPNARRPALLGKPGEQVYAVRFAGSRGYLVTFRLTDPLYVLDLADPADPKIAGELELPGFSDWLIPLSDRLLFGVGRDVDAGGQRGGVKVALLDVGNAAAPRQIASQVLGDNFAQAGLEVTRHGLNLLQQGSVARLAMPLVLGSATAPGYRNGLARFEVDVAAGSFKPLPWLGEQAGSIYPDLAGQRSMQIGAHAYYLRDGVLSAHAW